MALKNLFDMVKADRYTQDGREAIIKAQEAETEDKVYQIGEISQTTGLQKTANGWVKPKKGAAPAKKENPTRTFEFKAGPDGNPVAGSGKEVKTYKTKKEAQEALKKQNSAAGKHPPKVMPEGMSPAEFMKAWEDDAKKNGFKKGQGNEWRQHLRNEENKTTIRQGPNTKTLNETPAEHVQKNLDAYKGYQPYDMEELVLKPSGYEKQTSARTPGGGQSVTYTKNGAEDITLFFDKNGELENADIAAKSKSVDKEKLLDTLSFDLVDTTADIEEEYNAVEHSDNSRLPEFVRQEIERDYVNKTNGEKWSDAEKDIIAEEVTRRIKERQSNDAAPSLSEIVDRVYNIGEISEKTGLQKTANGWRPVKKGAAGKTSRADKEAAIRKDLGLTEGEDLDRFSDEQIETMYAKTQQTPEQQKADFDKSKIGQAVNKGRQEFAAEKTRQKELASKTNAIGLPKENNLSDIPDFKGMESGDYDKKLRAEGWTTGGWEGSGTHASAIFKKGDRTIRVNEGQPGKITSIQEIKPAENKTVEKFDVEKWKTAPKEWKNAGLDWSHGVVGKRVPVKGKSPEEIKKLIEKYNSVGRLSRIGTKNKSWYNNKYGTFEVAGIDNENVYIQEKDKDRGWTILKTIPLNEIEEINPFHDYGKRNPDTGEESPTRPPLPEDAAPRQLTGDCRIRVRKA